MGARPLANDLGKDRGVVNSRAVFTLRSAESHPQVRWCVWVFGGPNEDGRRRRANTREEMPGRGGRSGMRDGGWWP